MLATIRVALRLFTPRLLLLYNSVSCLNRVIIVGLINKVIIYLVNSRDAVITEIFILESGVVGVSVLDS